MRSTRTPPSRWRSPGRRVRSACLEARADARGARLLAGAVVAMQSTRLDSPVHARDEPGELALGRLAVARLDRLFEAAEPGLDLGGALTVLEPLTLRPA